MSDIRKAIMERLGAVVEGEKAKMAASVRRGVDPKKGGQWITGTWDGGTWSAMVFSEPSEAYGIPEFPHISKLSINPKDKPGIAGMIVNYDRGWDIKPNTPELQKAYREIAQIATAEVNKAVKQGWYSRPGAKAEFVSNRSNLAAVGKQLRDLEKAIDTARSLLREDAKQARWGDCINRCEYISQKYQDLKVAYRNYAREAGAWSNPTTASRSGAKATMGKAASIESDANKAFQLLQQIHKDASVNHPVAKVFSLLSGIIAAARMMERQGYARPGAKANFGSKRTTAGALRKQLKAQGMTDAAELEWHGISASDPDSTPYWLHEDGSMEKIKSSRPGAKAAFDRRIEVDHWTSPKGTKYVAGVHERGGGTSFQPFISATYSDGGEQLMTGNAPTFKTEKGARKWLDTEIGRRKSVSSRPGAKARFDSNQVAFFLDALASQVIDQKDLAKKNAQSAADYVFKHGTDEQIKRFVQLAERVGLRVNMSRPGAKATAAKPDDTEREDVKAGLKLMEKADKAVSDKIRTLIKEGKPQDQAVAIALDMKRRGEL